MSIAWQSLPSPLPTKADAQTLKSEMRHRFGFVAAESARWVQSVLDSDETLVQASTTSRTRCESADGRRANWGGRGGGPLLCLTTRRCLLFYAGRWAPLELSGLDAATVASRGRLTVTTTSADTWRFYFSFWVRSPRRAHEFWAALRPRIGPLPAP